MSDWYFALVDTSADPSNAQQRAETLRDALIAERIILSETSESCVFGGVGHLPGPRLNESYVFAGARPDRPPELRYWDMLDVCGVQFHVGKWVNTFGFIVFEWARCPQCGKTFENGSEIMQPLGDSVGEFFNDDDIPLLMCPECREKRPLQSWLTQPHLGLCHMAVQFWNWPPFDAKGWRISIPEIASRALGCALIATYGRM